MSSLLDRNAQDDAEGRYENLKHITTDPIVDSVVKKFQDRSAVGIKKYGTTLHDNNTDDFLNHLQEELMDAILYIEKLKSINK
jgi:hypothetical protein